jgi:hypothetical protein
MPRIENDVKLDFKDVLIRPKRSTLKSREEVRMTGLVFSKIIFPSLGGPASALYFSPFQDRIQWHPNHRCQYGLGRNLGNGEGSQLSTLLNSHHIFLPRLIFEIVFQADMFTALHKYCSVEEISALLAENPGIQEVSPE